VTNLIAIGLQILFLVITVNQLQQITTFNNGWSKQYNILFPKCGITCIKQRHKTQQ